MLPAFQDLDLFGGVRHVRAKGFRPSGWLRPARARRGLRQGFSHRHYRRIRPPSAD